MGRPELVSLQEKITIGICFENHVSDAELVEQGTLRKTVIIVATSFNTQSDEIVRQHGIGITVSANGVWWPLQSTISC